MIAFDIETGPLIEEVIHSRVDPFEEPRPPGPFDLSEVRLGNLKDQAKIDAKIEAARAKREAEITNHHAKVFAERGAWWADILDKAALSPLTGRVLAIAYLSTDRNNKIMLDINEDESVMLMRFWDWYIKCRRTGRLLVGHNIHGFDVPFMVRRSWMLGIPVPDGVIDQRHYIDSRTFVDTLSLWRMGNRQVKGKLDLVARALGVGGKLEGVDGSMFAELLVTDRETAEQYLRRDVEITARVAMTLGVV